LSGWVAQNNKPILNGNPSVEPGYLNDPTKYSTLRSALAVPLAGVADVVATLALYRSDQDAFTQDHLRILLVVSSKLGFTIENALKYRLAEDSATTDYLTSLPNARSLFLYLDREIARCKRSCTPLAVLVCDLDGFKQVNDHFGHLQGNRLLQMFASALKDCCREYDYAARMGGDEFVIVASGLEAHTAAEMMRRLEGAALEVGQKVCGGEILSVSVGCAFYPDGAIDAEQLLAEADRSMYNVKRLHHAATDSNRDTAAAGAASFRT
jgi:diguanylate cyclase (GGDEF)-like protein